MLRINIAILSLGLTFTVGCGGDRDENVGSSTGVSATATGGGGDDGGYDGGTDGGDGGDDGGAAGDGPERPDAGESGPDPDPTTGGDDGGDPPVGDDPPDCSKFRDVPSLSSLHPPLDADEMWCYTNAKRVVKIPHNRYKGFPWTGESHDTVTWPYEFAWDVALRDEAQAEAERVAAGGAPRGTSTDNGWDYPLFFDGVNSDDYVITSINDRLEHWPDAPNGYFPGGPDGGDPVAGLCSSNGTVRVGLHYHDPGGDGPVLTRMGVGHVNKNVGGSEISTWVLILRP